MHWKSPPNNAPSFSENEWILGPKWHKKPQIRYNSGKKGVKTGFVAERKGLLASLVIPGKVLTQCPLLRRTVHFLFHSLVRCANRFVKQKMPRNGALGCREEGIRTCFLLFYRICSRT